MASTSINTRVVGKSKALAIFSRRESNNSIEDLSKSTRILIANFQCDLVDRLYRELKCLARFGYPHVLYVFVRFQPGCIAEAMQKCPLPEQFGSKDKEEKIAVCK